MKKAILFDLDHTLYNYEVVHVHALEQVYDLFKTYFDISQEEFLRLYDMSKKEIHRELIGTASSHNRVLYFQRLLEKVSKTVEPEMALELYDRYWNSSLAHMQLDEGVLELLKSLKDRGIKTGLVTDLTTHIQLRKMRQLGISQYIDILITSEEAGIEKPHPSVFLLALNKLEILAKDAVMVGDNLVRDIEGAKSLGMETIYINRSQKPLPDWAADDHRIPDHMVSNIRELREVIEQEIVG